MEIQEIKRRVDLLKQVTQQKAVLVKDVAHELKERQTELMQFILDNPGLFQTEQVWTYKKEPYYETLPFGKRQKYYSTVKDKCKGLGIRDVFLRPEDNYETDEWLAVQKARYARTVWVSEWNNYGVIEGHYVAEDKKKDSDKLRMHLWRNTAEKIRELQELGILVATNFYIGGAFDCSTHKTETAIGENSINTAKNLGWTIISD